MNYKYNTLDASRFFLKAETSLKSISQQSWLSTILETNPDHLNSIYRPWMLPNAALYYGVRDDAGVTTMQVSGLALRQNSQACVCFMACHQR